MTSHTTAFQHLKEQARHPFLSFQTGAASIWLRFDEGESSVASSLIFAATRPLLVWLAVEAESSSRVQRARRSFGHHGVLAQSVEHESEQRVSDGAEVFADAATVSTATMGETTTILASDETRDSAALLWLPPAGEMPPSVWSLLLALWVRSRYGPDRDERYQLLEQLAVELAVADAAAWLPVDYREIHQVGAAILGGPSLISALARELQLLATDTVVLDRAWSDGVVLSITG